LISVITVLFLKTSFKLATHPYRQNMAQNCYPITPPWPSFQCSDTNKLYWRKYAFYWHHRNCV